MKQTKKIDKYKAAYILENQLKSNIDFDASLDVALKALKYCIENDIDFYNAENK